MTTAATIAFFLRVISNILFVAILVRACLSWFSLDTRGSGAAQLLDDICEPILAPLRRLIPPLGSIDISPLIAMILIQGIFSLIINQIH